jgi:hypothetical protein
VVQLLVVAAAEGAGGGGGRRRRRRNTREQSVPTIPDSSSINFAHPCRCTPHSLPVAVMSVIRSGFRPPSIISPKYTIKRRAVRGPSN